MEDELGSKMDDGATDRAKQLITDALRVMMEGMSLTHPEREVPQGQYFPRVRAQCAVRNIVNILFGYAEDYHLDADLRAALHDIATGYEPHLDEVVRQMWDDPEFKGKHEPPGKVQ